MADSRIIPTQAETDLSTFTILSNGQEVGGEIGIENIMVTKSVNRIPTARILLFDGSVPEENFEVSAGELFIPGNEVEIKAGYHADEDTIFKGIITKHSIQARKGKPSYLILEMKDASVKMTIGRKNKYFEEVSDSDIFEEIIGKYGLEVDVESTTITHAEMIQHHVTDWDFIVTRAEVNGKLVLVDDGKITIKAPDLSVDPIVELAYGQNVFEFEAGMDARDQYTSVKSTAWDMANQEVVESEAADPGLTEQGNFSASDLANVAGPDELLLQHTGKVADDELASLVGCSIAPQQISEDQGQSQNTGFQRY